MESFITLSTELTLTDLRFF